MKFLLIKKKSVLKVLSVVLLACVLTLGVSYSNAAGVYLGKTTRKLPIYSVKTEQKVVALSFDASWGATKTTQILETIKNHDICANFFAVGFWAEKYSTELKALSDSGVFEIGTHSNTHPNMSKLSASKINLELTESIKIIERITQKKVELFRAPFGAYNDTLIEEAQKLGLYTIQWDVDSLDWKGLSANDMAARVLNKVQNGSIILMHNDGEHTVQALPLIIEGLKNKGYTFTTIGKLIYRDNFYIDHTGRQIRS